MARTSKRPEYEKQALLNIAKTELADLIAWYNRQRAANATKKEMETAMVADFNWDPKAQNEKCLKDGLAKIRGTIRGVVQAYGWAHTGGGAGMLRRATVMKDLSFDKLGENGIAQIEVAAKNAKVTTEEMWRMTQRNYANAFDKLTREVNEKIENGRMIETNGERYWWPESNSTMSAVKIPTLDALGIADTFSMDSLNSIIDEALDLQAAE